MEACIFNIQRYSLHDGGGIRTLVFFKGCPFHCPWCCNPESLLPKPQIFYKEVLCMNCSKKINGLCDTAPEDCPTGAKEMSGEMKTVEEVFQQVIKDQTFYQSSGGGVTLSGGEFLMQIDFALELLKKCREYRIHTAVETTLALPIKKIDELIALTDIFLVDFKIFDENKAKEILNLNLPLMKQNVEYILSHGGKIIPRIPLIPGYTANDTNLKLILDYLKEHHLSEVHLLPFHQLGEAKYASINKEYTMHEVMPLSDEAIEKIEKTFIQAGFKTVIHGN